MKNAVKIMMFAFTAFGFTVNSYSQVSETADASATIIAPIAILKTGDMNFGNIAVSASDGTVILAHDGTRTKTGGVTLPASVGVVSAASFTVTGEAGFTYSITLPSTATTIDDNIGHTMTVDNFSCNYSPGNIATFTGGTSTLNVGATLNVTGSQTAGSYSSDTPFDVTVNYN